MKLHPMHTGVMAAILLATFTATAQPVSTPNSVEDSTVTEVYPGLASAGLTFAKLGNLPDGVLFRSAASDISTANFLDEIAKAPETARESLKKNGFFMLEQLATKKLLLEAARQQAAETKTDISAKAEKDLIGDYAQSIVGQINATDEEVAKFYEENKDACGGASLEQMKDQLKPYVVKEKQQDAFELHIRTLGQRIPITVSAAWVKEQAVSAKDNPVDKARGSGKPSMVDFGAGGCRPCDMMAPILTDLGKKYEGRANVLFVHVREEQILAARYRIQSIPVQVFFDKDGKETYRHTGFFAQADIEKKLAELGVQ